MSQIIGRFEPFMSCHKAFDVASMEPSDSMGDPGYIGKKVDGSSFHVFNKHWKWIPLWTGEGLPPVGLTCEFMWNYKREGSEYVKARVLFHDGGSAVVRILEGEGKGSIRESRGGDCGAHPIFKLIRTPEQIAAEQRRDGISKMIDDYAYTVGPCTHLLSRCHAERLYDLGYRKFEIVENEE